MLSSVLFSRIFLTVSIILTGANILFFWLCTPAVEQAIFRTESWYIKKNLENVHHALNTWHRERKKDAPGISPGKRQDEMLFGLNRIISLTGHLPSGTLFIYDRHFQPLSPADRLEESARFLESEDILTHLMMQDALKKAMDVPVIRVSYEAPADGDKKEVYIAWAKYLKEPGWYILISLRKSMLEKRQEAAGKIMTGIMAGSLSISILIFWFSLGYYIRPVKLLSDMAKEYLHKDVIRDLRYIADKGEVGTLSAVIYDAYEKLDNMKASVRINRIEHNQLFRSRERARERAWTFSKKIEYLEKDLMRHKEKKEQLSKSEERYRAMLENIEEYFYEADLLGNLIFFNDALYRGLGYAKDELVGMNFRDLMDEDSAEKAFWAFKRAYETGKPQKGSEWCLLRKDSSKFYIEISVSLIEDKHHEVIGFRGVARDVSNLIYLVNHDTLTGLNNRKAFFDRLEDTLKIARRDNRAKNIFYLDLNKFKKVNDEFGHDVGDEVLIEVARRLRATLRETDHICRLGGDEFTVILNNLNDEYLPDDVAKRVYQALSQPYHIDKHVIEFISPSIGISTYPKDADNLELLVRRADIAMFVIKAGGGGYLFYNPSLEGEFEALKKKGPLPR